MSTLHIELLDGDLYCCPVCYTEALLRHKGGSPKDDDDDGDISDDTTEFDNGSSSTATGSKSAEQRSDPMSILCSIGLHEASTFCYERISEVKEHVRSVHGFSPSVMAGNNLFHRFQIRGSDGLRQQHGLLSRWTKDEKLQFNTLKKHVSDEKLQFNTLKYVSKLELGFRYTFPKRAKKTWNMLIKPYLRGSNEDIVDDTDDENEFMPMPMLDQEQNPEESIVRYCRRKNKMPFDDDSSDLQESPRWYEEEAEEEDDEWTDNDEGFDEGDATEEDDDEEDEEDDDEEEWIDDEHEDSNDDKEEGREVDDWLQEKRMKPTAARKKHKFQRLLNHDSDDPPSPKVATKHKKRRRVIHEDESNDEEDGSK